jgi:hypothetical protein
MVEFLGAARVVTGRAHWSRRTRLHLLHLLLPVLLRWIRTHSLLWNWMTVTLRYGGCPLEIIYVAHGRVAIVIFIRTHTTYWRVHRGRMSPGRWHPHPLWWGDNRIKPLAG